MVRAAARFIATVLGGSAAAQRSKAVRRSTLRSITTPRLSSTHTANTSLARSIPTVVRLP